MTIENYTCDEPDMPTLSERLAKAMKEVDTKYPEGLDDVLGETIPLKYLSEFKYISCMKCYFCNHDDLCHLEMMPIMIWTYSYIYVFNRYHDDGSVISVYTFSEWNKQHAPHLFDNGKHFSV